MTGRASASAARIEARRAGLCLREVMSSPSRQRGRVWEAGRNSGAPEPKAEKSNSIS